MTTDTSWLETFGISNRIGTPDLLLRRDEEAVAQRGHAVERAFAKQVDAFLTIQDVPTVAFALRDEFDAEEIDELHRALWNQGLASVLVVRLPAEVRVYSLWQRPVSQSVEESSDHRLIESLKVGADALELLRLIPAVESGTYFERHPQRFDSTTRVDATLLGNLRETLRQLSVALPEDAARTLLLQVVFVSYLEDRGIIDATDFQAAAGRGRPAQSFVDLLAYRDARLIDRLFSHLRRTFNGDVFYAPGVFERGDDPVSIAAEHIGPLLDFRSGWKEMGTGQLRFWGYDFSFIPVELISSIYDRFLNEGDSSRKATGAYYTPRFLADLVVDQVWNSIAETTRSDGFTVLDPSCGSAIFLVRMFHRLAEHHKLRSGKDPTWPQLIEWLERLHGWDVSESAVRIGAFSLYIALLEQVHPPVVRALKAEGKILPRLLGKTLVRRDFFDDEWHEPSFDVIVGNPPWVSRQPEKIQTALRWCRQHDLPMPGGELAWAFVWKAARHLKPDGRVCLLLPAMGILLNHSKEVAAARLRWLSSIALLRIINFADVCFQLFDGADRPTVMALFRTGGHRGSDKIEYWVPKAHRLLRSTKILIVPTNDRLGVTQELAQSDPAVWKQRMWATGRDQKLLAWLSDLPRLGSTATLYSRVRRDLDLAEEWVIGQGFKPHHPDSESKRQREDFTIVDDVTKLSFLDASQFRPWVIPKINTQAWPTSKVHRSGYVRGFSGPHVLVPQGVVRNEGRVRAAYVEQSCSFHHSLQAITFPVGQASKAKLLTALLNSSLAAWYYFHTSANLGTDRAKVHEEQLLDLPFPDPDDTPDPERARVAQHNLVGIVDRLLDLKDQPLAGERMNDEIRRADHLVFDYYGLSEEEKLLITDSLLAVIPSMQPRKGTITALMEQASPGERTQYCRTLRAALREWLQPGANLGVRLIEGGAEAVLVELRLGAAWPDVLVEHSDGELRTALDRIFRLLPQNTTRNVEVQPNLKVFLKDSLYLMKPLNRRFWLASAGLNDADDIAGDLLAAQKRHSAKGNHERNR
ncbi:MAG: N-6 DNA methylase [Bryobacterales bacterium]|nr:N-6 DNA methylase [Bryobacterales bacterium]